MEKRNKNERKEIGKKSKRCPFCGAIVIYDTVDQHTESGNSIFYEKKTRFVYCPGCYRKIKLRKTEEV